MQNAITAAFIQQFGDTYIHQAQQRTSRLLKTVKMDPSITGESFTKNKLNSQGLMSEKTTRYADTQWGDAINSARVAIMRDFYAALPVDKFDLPKLIANPLTGGDYMMTLLASRERRIDDIIYQGLLGGALVRETSLTIQLPAIQKIAAGGTGLTKAKLIAAKKVFRRNEADEQAGEELYIVYDAEAMEDILIDPQLTSSDYISLGMLQSGTIGTKWSGFTWIPYENVQRVGTTTTLVAYSKSAGTFGIGMQNANVDARPDKQGATQVSAEGSYGFVRTDEEKVVQIDITV